MVGWDRSKASLRSQTHASPPAREATSYISLRRTGSASALSSGATCSACAADNGSADNGGQHATCATGSSTSREFDIDLY
jgi:hypothetical protein